MQIKDEIAKTKPRTDAQEPSLRGPTSSFSGTLGTLVQVVIHQPNHSGSQPHLSTRILSNRIRYATQDLQSFSILHPSVSLWFPWIPPQNASSRSPSFMSLQPRTHQGLYYLPLDHCSSFLIGIFTFIPRLFLEKTGGSSAYVYSSTSTLSQCNHYQEAILTIFCLKFLHFFQFYTLVSLWWQKVTDLLPKWQRIQKYFQFIFNICVCEQRNHCWWQGVGR